MVGRLEPFFSRCPACKNFTYVIDGTCKSCGFPFVCDIETGWQKEKFLAGSLVSRLLLFAGILAVLIYFTTYSYTQGEGYTRKVINELEREGLAELEIPVQGPEGFIRRVKLALTLLKRRAPHFYERVKENISSISFVPEEKIQIGTRRILLTGVSAYIDPQSGFTRIRASGAYLSGLNVLYDRDVFYLAGVLVHEMRHRELYKSGLNVGGLAEEFECESVAYDALIRMGAPRTMLYSIWQFLANPKHPRYKGWEKFYNQFE